MLKVFAGIYINEQENLTPKEKLTLLKFIKEADKYQIKNLLINGNMTKFLSEGKKEIIENYFNEYEYTNKFLMESRGLLSTNKSLEYILKVIDKINKEPKSRKQWDLSRVLKDKYKVSTSLNHDAFLKSDSLEDQLIKKLKSVDSNNLKEIEKIKNEFIEDYKDFFKDRLDYMDATAGKLENMEGTYLNYIKRDIKLHDSNVKIYEKNGAPEFNNGLSNSEISKYEKLHDNFVEETSEFNREIESLKLSPDLSKRVEQEALHYFEKGKHHAGMENDYDFGVGDLTHELKELANSHYETWRDLFHHEDDMMDKMDSNFDDYVKKNEHFISDDILPPKEIDSSDIDDKPNTHSSSKQQEIPPEPSSSDLKIHQNNLDVLKKGFSTGDMVISTIVALTILGVGYTIFQRFFSKAARACKGKTKIERKKCINKFKADAIKKEIQVLKKYKNICNKSKNPNKCKIKIDNKISLLKTNEMTIRRNLLKK